MTETPYRTLGDLALYGTEPDTGVEWSTNGPASSSWWSGAPSTVQTIRRTRAGGSWAGDAYAGAQHYTVEGLVSAPTPAALTDALDRLKAAASLTETTLTVVEDAGTRTALVRREDQVLPRIIHPTLASWSIQLVATDSRKFGATLTASTGLPTTTGGLSIPYTIPYTIDAVTTSGQVSLTNLGNAPGPVRLRIDGPVTGPVVTHVSTGLVLAFDPTFSMGSGEFLTVDMDARSVLAQGQVSRSGWLTSRQWSQFEPGVNVWAFTAATASPGALLTVSADPAWE